ncbi:MAG: carboxypeptidase-like regulatory domain-containing protein [Balneolaceae bacterium]
MKYLFYSIVAFLILLSLNNCDNSASSGGTDELKGTVSGLVVDASSSVPIAGATIRLSYIDEDFVDSVVTNQSGRFSIKDVPVNSAQIKISDDDDDASVEFGNYPYSLHIEMPDGQPYRSQYVFYPIFLTFSATGGDGNIDNLVSSILLPISKRNVTVTGKILDSDTHTPVSGLRVQAYTDSFFGDALDLGIGFDNEILLSETTTQTNGQFQFDAIEQGSDIYFKYLDRADSTRIIDGQSPTYSLPFTDSGEAYTKDVGEIYTSATDHSSIFYISEINLENGDDIDINSGVSFQYNFSKPVKQTNYTDDTVPFDINSGTMIDDILLFEVSSKAKDADGNYEIDVEWSNDYKTLTITPIDQMLDAYNYRLNTSAFLSTITDNEDNSLTYNSSTFVQSAAEAGVIDFSTTGDESAPANPNVSVRPYTLNWDGGDVTLRWTVSTSGAEIAYYEVYTRKDDINFTKMGTIDASTAFNNVVEANIATGLLVKREQSSYDTPVSLEIKLKAVSKNLVKSNFSNTVTISDNVKPGLQSAGYSNADSTITATFSEPMDFETLENTSRYQIIDNFGDPVQDISITDIRLVFSTNGITQVELHLSEQNNTVTNFRLIVATSITDINGNGMDNNDEDDNFTFNEVDIN